MIQIKKEFTKGNIELLEIYDNDFKILEKTNNTLWNTDENHTIIIVKNRIKDYIESTIKAEKIIEDEINE